MLTTLRLQILFAKLKVRMNFVILLVDIDTDVVEDGANNLDILYCGASRAISKLIVVKIETRSQGLKLLHMAELKRMSRQLEEDIEIKNGNNSTFVRHIASHNMREKSG